MASKDCTGPAGIRRQDPARVDSAPGLGSSFDSPNRDDPDKRRPLITSFKGYYGLGSELRDSTLAEISKSLYRTPDVGRASEALAGA